jgi:hypothetical protein
MKNLILIKFILFSSVFAFAGKFSSSVKGLSYNNAHFLVEERGEIYRGSEPKEKVQDLIKIGITDVLILKNDTRGEISKEIKALKAAGISDKRITHLDVTWKDADFVETCTQYITGLKHINEVLNSSHRKMYFHCTAGEDRTGMMAGLVRQLQEKETAERAFYKEMCEKGFADGNPGKPYEVSSQIYSSLLPVYEHLSRLIKSNELSWTKLSPSVCKKPRIQSTSKLRCK